MFRNDVKAAVLNFYKETNGKTITLSQYNMRQDIICERIELLHLLPELLLLTKRMQHFQPIRAKGRVLLLSVILMKVLLNRWPC